MNPDLIITLGAIVAFSIIVAFIILAAIRKSRDGKPKKAPQPPTPPWVWVFVLAVVALITYAFGGEQPAREPAPATLPFWVIWAGVLGLFVALIALLYAQAYYQIYDRAASRALKRARSGDTAGAIDQLRAVIEADRGLRAASDDPTGPGNPYASPRPPDKRAAIRANAMGSLYSLREEWDEAYVWFQRAEAEGLDLGFTLGNQGLALSKLGRPDEAIPLLEKASLLRPEQVAFPSNLGHLFADLGRIDEAHQQLAKAEANLKKILWAARSDRKSIDEELDRLREKLRIVKE